MLKTVTIRRALLSIAVLSMFLVLPSKAFAGDQDFTLHNATGREISEVYVSSHDTTDWEEDVLGEDTLAADDSVKITFPKREDAEDWDMKVVFSDGKSSIWENLRLTEITDVTISFKKGKPYATTQNGD